MAQLFCHALCTFLKKKRLHRYSYILGRLRLHVTTLRSFIILRLYVIYYYVNYQTHWCILWRPRAVFPYTYLLSRQTLGGYALRVFIVFYHIIIIIIYQCVPIIILYSFISKFRPRLAIKQFIAYTVRTEHAWKMKIIVYLLTTRSLITRRMQVRDG